MTAGAAVASRLDADLDGDVADRMGEGARGCLLGLLALAIAAAVVWSVWNFTL